MIALLAPSAMADITGKVTDEGGGPLEGIRVSNGFQVVLTKEDGTYALPYYNRVTTISVVVPADRKTDAFWLPVTRDKKDGYDFSLTARPKRKSFSFMHFSDLETFGNSLMGIYSAFRDRILAEDDAAFVIHSGDICYENGMKITAQEYKPSAFGGLPTYISMGNHDMIRGYERGEQLYEELFGPTRYAFVEGDVLFIVLPMMYGDASNSFNLEQIAAFTENMLNSWPKGGSVFFVTHYYHPYFDRGNIFAPAVKNSFDLSPWKILGVAYGHTHYYVTHPDLPVPLYNVGQSHLGGGGNMPGGARIFHVDERGKLTTELVESNAVGEGEPLFSGFCDEDGRITVTAFHSKGTFQNVIAEIDGQILPLKKVNGWLWTETVGPRPKAIRLSALFRQGLQCRMLRTDCRMEAHSARLTLQKAIPLPGNKTLFGTPAVDGNRIYVALADEDNSRLGGVCACDAATGRILWTYTTGFSVRNTPVLEQGMLYFSDADSNIYKLNATDGSLVWKNPFPGTELNFSNHSGPSLGQGMVFAGCTHHMRAVDQASGKTVWTFTKQFGGNELGTTQGPLYHDGRIYFAANWGYGCLCFDAASGELLWYSNEKEPTKGFLFQPTLAMLPNGNLLRSEGTRGLTILDAKTGDILKEMKKPQNWGMQTAANPLVDNGVAYCGTDWLGVCAVDLETLELKWDIRDAMDHSWLSTVQYRGPMKSVEATPVLADGVLLVAGVNAKLALVNPADGAILDSFQVDAPMLSSPVCRDGKIYVADNTGRLLVFQMKE